MSKIKEIPLINRPREKALTYGIESLSNIELLSIIIKNGTISMSALEISEFLINEFITLNDLFSTSIDRIKKIKGIKDTKAIEILIIGEIIKRMMREKIYKKKEILHPVDLIEYFIPILKNEKQENFFVIFLDTKNNIIKYENMFKGSINSAVIDINLIFKNAILLSSYKIICIHNHPSGDVEPSKEDLYLTNKIYKIGKIINILLLDHIIIGKDNYYSMAKHNVLFDFKD